MSVNQRNLQEMRLQDFQGDASVTSGGLSLARVSELHDDLLLQELILKEEQIEAVKDAKQTLL